MTDSHAASVQRVADGISGLAYVGLIRAMAERCDATTRLEVVARMGVKAPALVQSLGTVMARAEQAGSCTRRCRGGDHAIEHLIGSCVGTTNAGLLLAYSGYYDEALSEARKVGERANLLALLGASPEALADWRAAKSDDRQKRYSAVKVRLALEAHGAPIPTPQDRYKRLSSYGTHPGRVPQHHDPARPPTMGGIYDELGFLLALNELARAMVLSSSLSVPLLQGAPVELIQAMVESFYAAVDDIGGATVDQVDDFLAGLDRSETGAKTL